MIEWLSRKIEKTTINTHIPHKGGSSVVVVDVVVVVVAAVVVVSAVVVDEVAGVVVVDDVITDGMSVTEHLIFVKEL